MGPRPGRQRHDHRCGRLDFELIVGDSSVGDDSITAAGNDHIVGNGGDDFIFGDNVDFTASFTVGTASGNDKLEGAPATTSSWQARATTSSMAVG